MGIGFRVHGFVIFWGGLGLGFREFKVLGFGFGFRV